MLLAPPAALLLALALPVPGGPHPVGRRTLSLADPDRGGRELAVWIWYPAAPGAGSGERALPVPAWADLHREVLVKRLGVAAAKALLALETPARRDAPVAPAPARLPVLLFAPGLGWLPTDYATLLADVASRGYVVVSFAPPGISPSVVYPDGRVARPEGSGDEAMDRLSEDFRFLRRRLEDVNRDPGSPFGGRLDLARVGAFGHSIGGAMGVAAARRDARIRAVADLDGDFLGSDLPGPVRQPILYVTTQPPGMRGAPVERWDEEPSEARRRRVWDVVRGSSTGAIRVRTPGLLHANFLDAALAAEDPASAAWRAERVGPVDPVRALALATSLVATFFDGVLKGDAAADLGAVARDFPEIRIERAGNGPAATPARPGPP